MGLRDITRTGILAAVAEYDKLGQDEFLRKYGFDLACSYPLRRLGFAVQVSGELRLVNTATSGYFAVLQHRREGPELQVLYLWSLVVSHGYDHQSLPAVAERVT